MSIQITLSVLQVLRQMMRDPTAHYYGLELSKHTRVPIGSLYPILARLEQNGWLTGHMEDIDPKEAGRPPRKYYQLTAQGEQQAKLELNKQGFRVRPKKASHA